MVSTEIEVECYSSLIPLPYSTFVLLVKNQQTLIFLGFIRKSVASSLRKVISPPPLLSPGGAASGVLYPVLGSPIQEKKEIN